MQSLYDVMSKRTWLKNMLGSNENNSACLVGGVAVAMYGDNHAYDTRYAAECLKLGEVAARLFPERLAKIPDGQWKAVWFNNHPETTYEEMLKVCRVYDEERELEG